MIRIIRLSIFLALLSALAGCSNWYKGDFTDPRIELVQVEVVRAKLLEQQFILHFRIDNPNAMILPVRGLVYNVHLNGVKLAEGESDTWFTVPAYSHHAFALPVRTNLWRHLKQIVKLLDKPDQPIGYTLDAQIQTGLLFAHKVHLTRDGEIIPGDYIPE